MQPLQSLRSQLTTALSDGSYLLDSSSGSPHNLKSILEDRLLAYYAQTKGTNAPQALDTPTLEIVQVTTAKEALSVLERVQSIVNSLSEESTEQTPTLGTRDLAQLRTLLSLVFKWGIAPLLRQVNDVWATPASLNHGRVSFDYETLSGLTTRAMTVLFPEGVHGRLTQTVISTTLMNRHVSDILHPTITLGWLPKSLSTPSMPVMDHLRPLTMRLISILPPSSVIAALGTILSFPQTLPAHVRKTCASFLTQQLLRPGGVSGLCESVFGEEESSGEEVELEKLEQISRTLISVPTKMAPSGYYKLVVPKIIQLLSERYPASYRKTAAFTISRLLSSDNSSTQQGIAASVVCNILQTPFLQLSPSPKQDGPKNPTTNPPGHLQPSEALSRLIILISNSDPSPIFMSKLLSPIIPTLYSFAFHLSKQKTSDPGLKEVVQGLLISWGKIIDSTEAIDVLWSIVEEEGHGSWESDLDGKFWRSLEPTTKSPLSMLTPADIKQAAENEFDLNAINANIFDFYPDPTHFVRFLQSLDRGEVVSSIFVKLLEAYRELKSSSTSDSLKILHYLQIIMQMQLQLSGNTTASVLHKPDQLLAFIEHVLESASEPKAMPKPYPRHTGLPSDVRLAPLTSDNIDEDTGSADSDDDMPDSEIIKPDDEMLETAINLLLSILESHETLSTPVSSILNNIFVLLHPVSLTGSFSLRPLAREARMVITARSASSSAGRPVKRGSSSEERPQEVYQKALKLLQDPILPVRAHGLLLLRELVTPKTRKSSGSETLTDPALVPAVLSIFLQAIQDEDSYIFLNAVQGLAAMVDGFGKDVLRGLIREYSEGLETTTTSRSTQQDLDTRVRIGEALGTIIKRCGESLGKYGDILIPALIRVFSARYVPITLRTSSLSLLADCINTYALVMLPYTEDLAQGMVDLLQIEGASQSRAATEPKTTKSKRAAGASPPMNQDEMAKSPGDNEHLTMYPKYPPLRRAAIHLLTLLIRSTEQNFITARAILPFSAGFIRRAHVTLGYLMAVDEDAVVRVMARETKEDLSSLEESLLTPMGSDDSRFAI